MLDLTRVVSTQWRNRKIKREKKKGITTIITREFRLHIYILGKPKLGWQIRNFQPTFLILRELFYLFYIDPSVTWKGSGQQPLGINGQWLGVNWQCKQMKQPVVPTLVVVWIVAWWWLFVGLTTAELSRNWIYSRDPRACRKHCREPNATHLLFAAIAWFHNFYLYLNTNWNTIYLLKHRLVCVFY